MIVACFLMSLAITTDSLVSDNTDPPSESITTMALV